MHPTLFFRRLRRHISSTFFTLTQYFSTPAPKKHIKIDDEESAPASSIHSHHHPTPLRRIMKMLLLLLLVLLGVVLLSAYSVWRPPTFLIRWFQRHHPDVIFHLPLSKGEKFVALTIDDAPSPYTPALLELLKEYNASATFFVIGSQLENVDLGKGVVQRIVKEGHEVGNHAWRDEASISLPLEELKEQIEKVDGLLPKNEGRWKWFRPGSGVFNRKMVDSIKMLGYTMVLGSVYPHDAQVGNAWWNRYQRTAKWNAGHIVNRVSEGGVIIMHDRRPHSVDQLRLVLEGLGKRGWKVANLGQLVKIKEESDRKRKPRAKNLE